MRGGGRSLAYQHPENLLPGLNNQVPHHRYHLHLVLIIDLTRTSCLTKLQVSVRFWPGLWRGSEGFASRDELLLVMRDVEQVDLPIVEHIVDHIVEHIIEHIAEHIVEPATHSQSSQLLIRAQHLSEGRVDVTVEQIQLETGKAGGQVLIKMVTG